MIEAFVFAVVVFLITAAAALRPAFASLAWAFLLPIQLDATRPLVGINFAPSDVFGVSICVGAGVQALRRGSLPRANFVASAFCFLGVLSLGSLVAYIRIGSLGQYALINKVLGFAFLLATAYSLFFLHERDSRGLYRLLAALFLGSLATSCANLALFLTTISGGLPSPAVSSGRLAGLLLDSNAYGGYLATVFFVQIGALAVRHVPLPRGAQWANLLLVTLCLILTFSRSAWLGFAIGLLAFWALQPEATSRRVAGSIILGGPIVVILAMLAAARGMFGVDQLVFRSSTVSIRWLQIIVGLELWATSPIFGIGLGVFPLLASAQLGGFYIIHNTYVWVLVELGIFGLLVLLWMFLRVLSTGLRLSLQPWYLRPLSVGVLAAAFVMLGQMLGLEALYQRHFWLVIALTEIFASLFSSTQARTEGTVTSPATQVHIAG